MSHATEQQTIYIHALRQRLDIPLGTFMAALRSAYGVVMLGRLSQTEAATADRLRSATDAGRRA